MNTNVQAPVGNINLGRRFSRMEKRRMLKTLEFCEMVRQLRKIEAVKFTPNRESAFGEVEDDELTYCATRCTLGYNE